MKEITKRKIMINVIKKEIIMKKDIGNLNKKGITLMTFKFINVEKEITIERK